MTKIIGSMLIIVTGVGFGISESGGMKRHLDALNMLKRFITLFRSELEYSHAPFDEIFDNMDILEVKGRLSINRIKKMHSLKKYEKQIKDICGF